MAGAPYIVWSPDGETPPKISYATHAAAHSSACRMASLHPGQQFYVMGRSGRGAKVVPVDPDVPTGCTDDMLPGSADEIRAAVDAQLGAA
jgi:hypothetical protein